MTQPARKIEWLVWAGLCLIVLTVMLVFLTALIRFRAGHGKPLPVYCDVAAFTLTNQNGRAVGLADLKGHVWVADIIFTRCAGPCPRMTRQMEEIQRALPPASSARLISLTTDPAFDTPSVLKNYAERFKADPERWSFLTGPPQKIHELAVDSLKLTALEKPAKERESEADLFIHSTIFVLVDKQARLRGVYETSGEGIDPQQVKNQILAAIRKLEREP